MKEQLQSLLELLNQGLVQRQAVIKPVLLAALAGENPVLVGPPGTGKSLIARRIAQCFPNEDAEQGSYFEYLLTKFSTPEEIFGPLSISELKQDRFKRNTAGYLPSVRVAFLDEIFKASSSILNALLTILNERVYHNGAQVQRVPLQALIAASNELPTEHEELSALYDRFLLRVFVDYVGIEQLPALFAHTTEPEIPASLRLTQQQLAAIRSAADAVSIPDDIVQAVQQIWAEHQTAFKEDTRERLSDRRLKKLIHLMRVSAATNGRDAVDLSDVLLLKDSLWNHPDNREKVMELLRKVLGSYNQIIPVPAGQSAPSAKQGAAASAPLPKKGTGQMNAVVKGYKGRGTEDDPLLIESEEDLVDLARPEVGQMGYYFQQTQDINIKNERGWPEIIFHGVYDGWRFQIHGSKYDVSLFSSICDSHIKNLKSNIVLSKYSCTDTIIEDCKLYLIRMVSLSDGSASKIQNCNIKYLIVAGDTQIDGCIIYDLSIKTDGYINIDNTNITNRFYREKYYFKVFINNVDYLDCGPAQFDSTHGLATIPIPTAQQRTQRYFEHTLGFDFENIWRWDDASNAPVLRHVGVGAKSKKNDQTKQTTDEGSVDLLSMQTQANIWL